MITHAFTNASANFFSSIRARSQDSERVARRNSMPQLIARSFRARHNTQLHVMPRLRPAASRNCGHQLHLPLVVTRACPPPGFHVIITTCVGLRKRRARARILLASNPAKACCSPLSLSTAASRNCGHDRFMGLATLAPHRNIYAFRYERKRKMHSQPPPRSPPRVAASTP